MRSLSQGREVIGISFFKEWIWKLGGRRRREAMVRAALESWRVIHVSHDSLNEDLIARVRIDKPSLPRGVRYDTAVLITWAYEGEARSLPGSETTDRMTEFEEAIDALTSENGFAELVCVRTGLGERQWLFYSRDRARFMTELNGRLAGHPRYPLEIHFDDDPEWTIWKEFLDDIEPHL